MEPNTKHIIILNPKDNSGEHASLAIHSDGQLDIRLDCYGTHSSSFSVTNISHQTYAELSRLFASISMHLENKQKADV